MSNELLALTMFVLGVKHAYRGIEPEEFEVRSLAYDHGYACAAGSGL